MAVMKTGLIVELHDIFVAVLATVERNGVRFPVLLPHGWAWTAEVGDRVTLRNEVGVKVDCDGMVHGYERVARELITRCGCRDGRYRKFVRGHAEDAGPCYRCHGRGWQTADDRRRNSNYDNYVRRIPA